MYPILIRSLVAMALALICAANISKRCTGMELFKFDPSVLLANCQNDKGEINPSSIDLNTCIGFDLSESSLRYTAISQHVPATLANSRVTISAVTAVQRVMSTARVTTNA